MNIYDAFAFVANIVTILAYVKPILLKKNTNITKKQEVHTTYKTYEHKIITKNSKLSSNSEDDIMVQLLLGFIGLVCGTYIYLVLYKYFYLITSILILIHFIKYKIKNLPMDVSLIFLIFLSLIFRFVKTEKTNIILSELHSLPLNMLNGIGLGNTLKSIWNIFYYNELGYLTFIIVLLTIFGSITIFSFLIFLLFINKKSICLKNDLIFYGTLLITCLIVLTLNSKNNVISEFFIMISNKSFQFIKDIIVGFIEI